jgi:hypothetical protein
MLQTIMDRRNSLAGVQSAHQGGIGVQTTVAGVAAYDITAGW